MSKVLRWYFRPASIIVIFLLAGPMALPLVWLSPAFKRWQKAVISLAVIAVSVWLVKAILVIYASLLKNLQELKTTLQY